MNLEINIKVPLGAGVSVSQRTEPDIEAEFEPPPIPELHWVETDIGSGEAPPPSFAELGLDPVVRQPEPTSEAPPPSLAELGLTAEGPGPVIEPEPPSLQMLEAESEAAVSEVSAAPPALEELGVETAYDTEEMAPPAVEGLEAMMENVPSSPDELAPAKKTPARKGRSTRKAPLRMPGRKG